MPTTSAARLLTTNESQQDRRLRIVFGVAILVVGLTYGSWWGLVGLVPVLTGAAGFCPLYAALGIDTRRPRTT
jgi:hypothetical protein